MTAAAAHQVQSTPIALRSLDPSPGHTSTSPLRALAHQGHPQPLPTGNDHHQQQQRSVTAPPLKPAQPPLPVCLPVCPLCVGREAAACGRAGGGAAGGRERERGGRGAVPECTVKEDSNAIPLSLSSQSHRVSVSLSLSLVLYLLCSSLPRLSACPLCAAGIESR